MRLSFIRPCLGKKAGIKLAPRAQLNTQLSIICGLHAYPMTELSPNWQPCPSSTVDNTTGGNYIGRPLSLYFFQYMLFRGTGAGYEYIYKIRKRFP